MFSISIALATMRAVIRKLTGAGATEGEELDRSGILRNGLSHKANFKPGPDASSEVKPSEGADIIEALRRTQALLSLKRQRVPSISIRSDWSGHVFIQPNAAFVQPQYRIG